jgi:hypothetical protein
MHLVVVRVDVDFGRCSEGRRMFMKKIGAKKQRSRGATRLLEFTFTKGEPNLARHVTPLSRRSRSDLAFPITVSDESLYFQAKMGGGLTEIKGTALRCAENRDGKAIWHWKKKERAIDINKEVPVSHLRLACSTSVWNLQNFYKSRSFVKLSLSLSHCKFTIQS